MDTSHDLRGVWVFGDYRNYFQNRVTLQLIAKAKDLAQKLNTKVIALALGDRVHQWAMEYVAHGADIVLAAELALPHRIRGRLFQETELGAYDLEEQLEQVQSELGPGESGEPVADESGEEVVKKKP